MPSTSTYTVYQSIPTQPNHQPTKNQPPTPGLNSSNTWKVQIYLCWALNCLSRLADGLGETCGSEVVELAVYVHYTTEV